MQQTRVRAVALPLVADGEWVEDAGEQQIPFGNDNKKSKGKSKSRSKSRSRSKSICNDKGRSGGVADD